MRRTAHTAGEWADIITTAYDLPVVVDHVSRGFTGALRHIALTPDLLITEIQADTAFAARPASLIHTGRSRHTMFEMFLDGTVTVEQDGARLVGGRGDALVFGVDRPASVSFGNKHVITMQLSPRLARLAFGTEQVAALIPAASPSLRVLQNAIRDIPAMAGSITDADRRAFGRVTGELLAALKDTVCSHGPKADSAREVLLGAIRQTVRDGVTDPALTPGMLADRHHISLRYLYKLFAETGTTPSAFIRDERIAAARDRLVDLRHIGEQIGEIAFLYGFSDQSSFVRAFRRRFGLAPSRYRARATADRKAVFGTEMFGAGLGA